MGFLGGTRGDWGAFAPPSLYVKKGPGLADEIGRRLHV
jgi:hypothetical protein